MKRDKHAKTHSCSKCGKSIVLAGSIHVNTYNPWRRYKGSGYPIVANESYKLCKKHFKDLQSRIDKVFREF